MDTIWGPALDAEVAYRQELVRAAVHAPAPTWPWHRRRSPREASSRHARRASRQAASGGQRAVGEARRGARD